MSHASTTCLTCGAELRPPVSAACPICLAELPLTVRAALADKAALRARVTIPLPREPASAQANPAQARAAIADAAVMRARLRLDGRQPTPSAPRTAGSTVYHAPSPWVDPSGKLAAPVTPTTPTAPVSYGRPVYAAPAPTIANPPQHAPQPQARAMVRQVTPALATRMSKLAVASLALGIVGLCSALWSVYGVVSLAAVIIGHIALSRINRSAGTGGRGMAIAGLVLGYLVIGLFVVHFIAILTTTPTP